MTQLRIIRSDEAVLGNTRIQAAANRYGLGVRFGSVENDLRAGTGVVVIADVGDDDPDADIAIYFHREEGDPAGVIWVVQIWGRSAKILRVFEAACVRAQALGALRFRWGNSTLPYSVQAATLTNATLSADGTYWEVTIAQALARIQTRIAQQGIPPL